MIKIVKSDDISKISDSEIRPYIENLFNYLSETFCANSSVEAVGAIYYLENEDDFNNYEEIGLFSPICENRFEWIDEIDDDYSDGCIVLNNSHAVNLIGRTEYFKEAFRKK